jgi:hypothetical protein
MSSKPTYSRCIYSTAPAERDHFSGLPWGRAGEHGASAPGKPTSNRPDIAPAGFASGADPRRPQKALRRWTERSTHPARRLN